MTAYITLSGSDIGGACVEIEDAQGPTSDILTGITTYQYFNEQDLRFRIDVLNETPYGEKTYVYGMATYVGPAQ